MGLDRLAPFEGATGLSAMDLHRPRFRVDLPHFRGSVSQVSEDLVVALGGPLAWRDHFDGDIRGARYWYLVGIQAGRLLPKHNAPIPPNPVIFRQGEFHHLGGQAPPIPCSAGGTAAL